MKSSEHIQKAVNAGSTCENTHNVLMDAPATQKYTPAFPV